MAWNVRADSSMNKILLLLATIAINQVASAQLLSIGVKGGVPFLDTNESGDESRPYIVGPSVEVRLPAGFAIEVDALYRRIGDTLGFNASSIGAGLNVIPSTSFYINRQRGNDWQFPVLGKYYFRPRAAAWQPFLSSGWALRTVGFHENISETFVDANGNSHFNSFQYNFRSNLGVGAVFAAGVRFRVGRLYVTPELRYTYWGSTTQSEPRKNEAAGLVGISF
jgi:hypothetical protein